MLSSELLVHGTVMACVEMYMDYGDGQMTEKGMRVLFRVYQCLAIMNPN